MNPSTVGGVLRRSPANSRRSSLENTGILVPNGGGVGAVGRHLSVPPQPPVQPQGRQRHHTGGGRGAGGDVGPLNTDAGLHRSGSWGGVNESEEDVRRAAALAANAANNAADASVQVGNSGQEQSEVPDEDGPLSPAEEDFRRRLAFFFLDPVRKYRARHQFPWKLALQFLKVVLVTAQVLVFGNYRYAHTRYFTDNRIALEHLFLRGWDSAREIDAYPPAVGAFALYKKDAFYSFLDNVAAAYGSVDADSVNPVFRGGSGGADFCVERFGDGRVFPNLTWNIDFEHLHRRTECIRLPENRLANLSSKSYLDEVGFPVPWDTLTSMKVNFTLHTLTYTKLGPLLGPECFAFHTAVHFDNSDYDGQMPITLQLHPRRRSCPEPRGISTGASAAVRALNYAVAAACVASFALCLRAMVRAQLLRREAQEVFAKRFGWELTASEKLDFLNGWYILIIINDVLIITGCALKESIEGRRTLEDLWDACALCLGTGNLLVWIGMLRYLGFFKAYNVLILTMKGALPSVLRFLLCAGLLYAGFVLCGWIVLGPYNMKFRTVLTASECLFSLVNGDDMFATFAAVPETSGSLVRGFARAYLYLFISLFIYVVLSLFIAIIMDTYEVIKEYYKTGFPKERMHEYYRRAGYDPRSGVFRSNSNSSSSSGSSDGVPPTSSMIRRLFHLRPANNGLVLNNGQVDRDPLVT